MTLDETPKAINAIDRYVETHGASLRVVVFAQRLRVAERSRARFDSHVERVSDALVYGYFSFEVAA